VEFEISHGALHTICLALINLYDRCDKVEEAWAANGGNGEGDLGGAEVESATEQGKVPAEQKPRMPPGREDEKYAPRFDISSGAQSQKTPQHPLGGNSRKDPDMRPTKPMRSRDSLQKPELPAALASMEKRLSAIEAKMAGGIGERNSLGQSIFNYSEPTKPDDSEPKPGYSYLTKLPSSGWTQQASAAKPLGYPGEEEEHDLTVSRRVMEGQEAKKFFDHERSIMRSIVTNA
jgi:hypothetical protein